MTLPSGGETVIPPFTLIDMNPLIYPREISQSLSESGSVGHLG